MDPFVLFWQHIPEKLHPELFSLGSFQVRYYSLMYLVAFCLTYVLVMYRVKKEDYPFSSETIQDLLLWLILGLIVGARLGYALFYNPSYYLSHPLELILPFEFSGGIRFVGISGMSYHGGAIGVLLAALFFCRKKGIPFWKIVELFSPAVPLGYTFGRIGNFINGELYGRVTTVPWGMYFPLDSLHQLRHPSQLYEAFFEGLILFVILWSIRRRSPFDGFLFAAYLFGYGFVRFFIEFFREPDIQLGLLWGGIFSMGQALCLLMMTASVLVYFLCKQKKKSV
ncbi:phosphatidylglycerol:prolipoprotein diacylglycerol transferase [Syntrophus gentianae]|uniref:Phosphatidylglycerol--prolipoprotein diacylglyceryl transferase n=1 Tax=Syntrophus gentianae TaxID=43775 RepID=A0A1H8BI05_9BACT|nr:prolipoprotein diacylglyceryl transferase [Syntrophus gentianae]SEM81754.1 phosphatidylglycerol:prolipoprotein diacylglycerol transferase [Syntrophus gentianae]